MDVCGRGGNQMVLLPVPHMPPPLLFSSSFMLRSTLLHTRTSGKYLTFRSAQEPISHRFSQLLTIQQKRNPFLQSSRFLLSTMSRTNCFFVHEAGWPALREGGKGKIYAVQLIIIDRVYDKCNVSHGGQINESVNSPFRLCTVIDGAAAILPVGNGLWNQG